MSKQFKRAALKTPVLKSTALKAKATVNGHALSHDEGFTDGEGEFEPAAVARHDEDAPVAADADLGWDDDEEELDPHGDADAGVDATDDPVRMYLMQMGQIPLLNRAEEISSAKRIEKTRLKYRHSMLATDYILQGAVEALEKVRDGQLRLDRTIEVSV